MAVNNKTDDSICHKIMTGTYLKGKWKFSAIYKKFFFYQIFFEEKDTENENE